MSAFTELGRLRGVVVVELGMPSVSAPSVPRRRVAERDNEKSRLGKAGIWAVMLFLHAAQRSLRV